MVVVWVFACVPAVARCGVGVYCLGLVFPGWFLVCLGFAGFAGLLGARLRAVARGGFWVVLAVPLLCCSVVFWFWWLCVCFPAAYF